jgi:type II secretory pathway component PulK
MIQRRSKHFRTGSVLIATMIVTFALAGCVIVMCRSMRVEALAASNLAASVQADSVERGAEQYLLAVLTQEGQNVTTLGEDQFAAVPVGNGYFWVLRPEYEDTSLPLFGLMDEAAKLNINSAGYERLMKLPAMTDDVASAIVDWRDEDNTPSNGGAENDYYLSRQPVPYYCKNAPFETVEELLMVRGITRQLLYGTGNAVPLGTVSSSRSTGSLATDPQLARGIYDLLTIYSVEGNGANTGGQRVNINDRGQRTQLRDLLRKNISTTRADQIMAELGRDRVRDVFDFFIRFKLTRDEITKIEKNVTTINSRTLRGRINVNTAPREVLLCLSGLESGDVDKLLGQRTSASTSDSLSWIVEALGSKAVGLESQITATSSQYSGDILAVSANGRSYKRVRIVIDIRTSTPQIVYRRDLTDRGWPMDKQILNSLRAGQGPGSSIASTGAMKSGNTQ